MVGFLKAVSTVLKVLSYGGGGKRNQRENGVFDGDGEYLGKGKGSQKRPPSAPSQMKPPIIRIRRERSLNGSTHQNLSMSASENNLSVPKPKGKGILGRRGSKSPSVTQAPRLLVADVIATSASYTNVNRPIERQVIRIINGADPSVQSQVLLNTKTSQPWEELVRDLGMAVKIGKRRVGSRMETLTGRMIESYSQLRSELKVGNQAFYVYSDTDDGDLGLIPNLQKHRLSVNSINNNYQAGSSDTRRYSQSYYDRKPKLVKTISNSSSDVSTSYSNSVQQRSGRQRRRRSHTPSPNRASRLSISPNVSPAPSRSPSPAPEKTDRPRAHLPQSI